MRRMGLKWHVKWDPLIINVLFKCKFVFSQAHSISLNLKFGLYELTTKAFPFLPQIVQLSARITQRFKSSDLVCTEASTVTRPAVGVHLLNFYQIWCHFVDGVVTTKSFEKTYWACGLSLPHLFPSLRCLECERRSTNAPLQWAGCPKRLPGDSSRC